MTRRAITLITATLSTLALTAPAHAADKSVKLLTDVSARAYPGGGKVVAKVAATRPLTGTATVLPVVAEATADGRPWVRVMLPGRPNGRTGWIPADRAIRTSNAWRITINLRARRAVAYRNGKAKRSFRVVVGKPSTPTPRGRFFVEEVARQPRGAAVGPWVLALSARSNVLRQFGGGPGQIGLHGRTGLPDPLGSAASHGCVRFADAAIRWLAGRISPGARVTIR
jgi:lipoprotein-anchoring transpeptidase ErfK/SrfK